MRGTSKGYPTQELTAVLGVEVEHLFTALAIRPVEGCVHCAKRVGRSWGLLKHADRTIGRCGFGGTCRTGITGLHTDHGRLMNHHLSVEGIGHGGRKSKQRYYWKRQDFQ